MEIGTRINCLDSGHVELCGYYGSDAEVVSAARISYATLSTEFTKKDANLIEFLMESGHWSPFQGPNITVRIKAPLFVLSQIKRHKYNALNEVSGRYTQLPGEMYLPDVADLRTQSGSNYQCSSEFPVGHGEEIILAMEDEQRAVYSNYMDYQEHGLSREMARINLPLSTYSEIYFQQSLRDALHLVRQRVEAHAQPETQVFARAYESMLQALFPVSVEAFSKYIRDVVILSRDEANILKDWIQEMEEQDNTQSLKKRIMESGLKQRQKDGFIQKVGL